MPYALYYNDVEPDIIFKCERCGHKREFGNYKQPMTATELEDRYEAFGGEVQEAMCKMLKPFIDKMIEIAKQKELIEKTNTL
jgi:hypothetical protein